MVVILYFGNKSCAPNGCKTCQVSPREEEIKRDDSPNNNGDDKEAKSNDSDDAGDVPELLRVDESNSGE